jgi:hydroxyacylglutathione hydrolase
MKPEIFRYVLGPLENNVYLLVDPESQEAALIDPSFDVEQIQDEIKAKGCHLGLVLLTHAHFDHIAGVTLAAPPAVVGLHPADLDLYRESGGARRFGLSVVPGPEPGLVLSHAQIVKVGAVELEVRHTPGHTPGHVIFVCQAANTAFCGDLIFAGSVGRTDFAGGSHAQLLESIRQQVFTLPKETRLLPGHGPETTVAEEMASNPFLN